MHLYFSLWELHFNAAPTEGFAKEVKDVFRARVRVAPTVRFAAPEGIAALKSPEGSRKAVKFIDRRR